MFIFDKIIAAFLNFDRLKCFPVVCYNEKASACKALAFSFWIMMG